MNSEPASTELKAPRSGAFSVGTQLLAFFAGIAGGLAFVQLFSGGLFGVFLAYLSPLPLFLVGLTCGRAAAVTAMLFALLTVYMRTLSVESTVFYAAVMAVPVMVMSRVALIKNQAGQYISGGIVLLSILMLGTLLMAASAILLELQGPGIAAATQVALDNYKAMILENNVNNLPPEQIDQSLAMVKPALPGVILMSWFLIITVTGVLSQWFASEIKQNLRPTPYIKTVELPLWMVGLFLFCFIGSMVTPTDTQMVLTALATLYAAGLVIAGLGAMHRWIDAKATVNTWSDGKRLGIYILCYAAIFILQIPVLFVLLFGLIAPFTVWRHSLTNGHSGAANS